jgi:hypothetical protein
MHSLAATLRTLAAAAEALAPLIDSPDDSPLNTAVAAPRAVESPSAARSLLASAADPPPPAGRRGDKAKAIMEFLAANPDADVEKIQSAIGCSRSHASTARRKFLEAEGLKKK